jgi:dTDP-4-amino-4,6-dideoxygalactose transaminase
MSATQTGGSQPSDDASGAGPRAATAQTGWQPVPLSERHRLSVYPTPVAYFADRIRRQQYFSHARVNRGFFEAWLSLRDGARSLAPARAGLLRDLAARLGQLPANDPDLFVATSHLHYPDSDRLEAGAEDEQRILAAIEETLPPGYVPHDGQLWKRGTIDGRIRALYDALRPLPVVAVGPEWLIELGGRLRLSRFALKAVDGPAVTAEREEFLTALLDEHARFCGAPVAYLFHAELLSPWLVLALHRRMRNAFLIDLGSALDVCDPARMREATWGRVHWHAIARNLGLDDEVRRGARPEAERPRLLSAHGPEPALPPAPARVRRRRMLPALDRRTPMCFVENKSIDFAFVQDALQASARANHWTNFGPATSSLEATLARQLDLPRSRRVVMCSSGTAALFGLAGLATFRAGRPLRWVTSAFGFHPARQGPYAGSRVVDCDARALLDLRALQALPDEAFDAVLLTNVFGALEDPGPYVRLCRERGKVLVLDSALALDATYRKDAFVPDEVVSFHHTKPWGMGEGGCVIVDEDDADVMRSIFNFGIYRGHATGEISFNGKLSDFASAFLLQRLRDFVELSPRYHLQHARIATIARRLGYQILGGIDRRRQATPANVPLLAPHPVKEEHLENPTVALRKYYRPLEAGYAVADDLYARIVNVPCHPGLERIPEESLRSCLARVLEASRPHARR